MQNNDKRTRILQVRRDEREHAQVSRIRAESGHFTEWAAHNGPNAARMGSKFIEPVQFSQPSQVIDVFGERHLQLLDKRLINTSEYT
jgi:hypothetical protein